ncbi:MAG: hypothetical protein ACREO6_00435 [Rudaea sp.]
MFVTAPLVSDAAPLARTPCHGSGRIVWQQRYEGIARVAYRGGKAIAGVSGPWSDRYVLIWWDELPMSANPLELFETAEAAMLAVEKRMGQAMPEIAIPGEPRREPGRSWWTGSLDKAPRSADSEVAALPWRGRDRLERLEFQRFALNYSKPL